MPKLDGILETAIHTEDMVRSRAFYEGVLGLKPIYSDDRLSAYAVAGRDVLLVFRKGTTGQAVVLPPASERGWGYRHQRRILAGDKSPVAVQFDGDLKFCPRGGGGRRFTQKIR
jgi:catechol 2,3-dioxygenase-like lactoylglutathione lyase family enzyme